MSSTLSEETIAQALRTKWLGHNVTYFTEIDSTNEWLKKQAVLDPSLADGALVVADFQSMGKGRLNRSWEAPPETSLLFSVFFRLHWEPERANWLTMIAGLATAEAIGQRTGLETRLKWPNDIVFPSQDGGWLKAGGVLLESTWKNGYIVQAVLGVGLNVNVPDGDIPEFEVPATSLQAVTGEPVERLTLLVDLLERLETRFEAACGDESPMLAWQERLILIGEPIKVVTGDDETLQGVLEGVDNWGNLRLRRDDGSLQTVEAGDVSLRR